MYIKNIKKKIRQTIRKQKLFTHKDRIAVAVSGGKDSISTLHVLSKLGYNIEAMLIEVSIAGYSDINLEKVKQLCETNKIALHVLSFQEKFGKTLQDMHSALNNKGYSYSPCMLCGILKRYLMNKYTRQNKFDALVTGHNLDDEAQAFVMNVFRNDFLLAARLGPQPGLVKQKDFVKRVKPMYYMLEEEIKRYSRLNNLPVNYGTCPLSKGAFRKDFKNMLNDFENRHPSVKYNIIKFQEQMKEHIKLPEYEIQTCHLCGEPASNETCKTCKILEELKLTD